MTHPTARSLWDSWSTCICLLIVYVLGFVWLPILFHLSSVSCFNIPRTSMYDSTNRLTHFSSLPSAQMFTAQSNHSKFDGLPSILAFLVLTGKRRTTIPHCTSKDAMLRFDQIRYAHLSFTVRVVRKEQGVEWLKATRGWDIGPLTKTFLIFWS